MHSIKNGRMDKMREGKSVICYGYHYTLLKKLNFYQNLTIGKLLEVIKYKIIGLNLSQLTKGILQKKINLNYPLINRRRYRMTDRRNNLFATKIRRQQVSENLPTHHVFINHVQDHNWNSHKNLHNYGRAELTASRAKRK
jgi:hypothetical protein